MLRRISRSTRPSCVRKVFSADWHRESQHAAPNQIAGKPQEIGVFPAIKRPKNPNSQKISIGYAFFTGDSLRTVKKVEYRVMNAGDIYCPSTMSL
jgi:hypothetical protein